MEVTTVAKTQKPEELILRAARQDYSSEYVYDHVVPTLLDNCAKDVSTVEDFIHKRLSRGEWGILEHPTISFGVEGVSREVLAHFTRHRHLTFDVQSMRYVDMSDVDRDTYTTPEVFTNDNYANRHGTVEVQNRSHAAQLYENEVESSFETYQKLVESGVPKEDARKVLPIAATVNLTVSGNARAWCHVLNMRMKFNAQNETRDLADMIYNELTEWIPSVTSWYDEHGPLQTSP